MDDLVEQAMERRRRLLAELERLDVFLETARLLKSGEGMDELPPANRTAAPASRTASRRLRPAQLVRGAEEALRAAGRPLSRGELFERVSASGLVGGGVDPVKNFGTVLWRSKRFSNAGRLYWFAGETRPAL